MSAETENRIMIAQVAQYRNQVSELQSKLVYKQQDCSRLNRQLEQRQMELIASQRKEQDLLRELNAVRTQLSRFQSVQSSASVQAPPGLSIRSPSVSSPSVPGPQVSELRKENERLEDRLRENDQVKEKLQRESLNWQHSANSLKMRLESSIQEEKKWRENAGVLERNVVKLKSKISQLQSQIHKESDAGKS